MKFKLEIDGETVELDPDDLAIGDVQADAPKAAAAIFYWGSVAAALRQSLENARTDYRQARASAKLDAITREPKLAEWKITAAFEASETFRNVKAAINHWQRLYDQAQAIYLACQSRASTIQTIYKHETGGQPFAGSLGDEKQAKTDKLRDIMRKRKGQED